MRPLLPHLWQVLTLSGHNVNVSDVDGASKCLINHSQWQFIHWETKLSKRIFYNFIVNQLYATIDLSVFISFEGYCLPTNGLFYYLEQVEVMVELYCLLKKWKYWNLGKYYWNIGGIFNNNCIAVNNSSMHFPIKPWYFYWTGEFSWFDSDLTHPGFWFDPDASQ